MDTKYSYNKSVMMCTLLQYLLIFLTLTVITVAKCQGDYANCPGQSECILLKECPRAIEELKRNIQPQTCGFQGRHPFVCCFPPTPTLQLSSGSLQKRKAYKECKTRYGPLEEGVSGILVTGGIEAEPGQFPHMAALGYQTTKGSNIRWYCGGTIIDDKYILTAAHCIITPEEIGRLVVVRLGDLDLSSDADSGAPEDYGIRRTIVHPQYRSNAHYNDIALIEVNRTIILGMYAQIACLDVNDTWTSYAPDARYEVAGWGKTDFGGDASSALRTAELKLVTFDTCDASFRRSNLPRKLPRGIDRNSQVCAGGDGKDTCQGDSGGPLTHKIPRGQGWSPHYQVIGVTSFGKACGIGQSIGVYALVRYFIPWIESIVWP